MIGGTETSRGRRKKSTEAHYYYAGWRLVEMTTGTDTLGQWVWGVQYIDEAVVYDRNTDYTSDDDCLDAGSARYTYSQDANFRVVALTNESGAVVERYEYSAYGEPVVYDGVRSGSLEYGNATFVSLVGNPFMHQGLFRDGEIGTYHNRYRQYSSMLGRFGQTDALGFIDGMNRFAYENSNAVAFLDSTGLETECERLQKLRDEFREKLGYNKRLLEEVREDMNLEKLNRDSINRRLNAIEAALYTHGKTLANVAARLRELGYKDVAERFASTSTNILSEIDWARVARRTKRIAKMVPYVGLAVETGDLAYDWAWGDWNEMNTDRLQEQGLRLEIKIGQLQQEQKQKRAALEQSDATLRDLRNREHRLRLDRQYTENVLADIEARMRNANCCK